MSETATETVNESKDVVTVERIIPAAPSEIFALLVDPTRHREFDGSGTVRDASGEPGLLSLGSSFGMSMQMGVPYAMKSTVTEFEPDRRIAWQTRVHGPLGRFVAGRTWRYELEPVDGGTRVRESWDISTEAFWSRPLVRLARTKTRENMEKTLAHLAGLLAGEE